MDDGFDFEDAFEEQQPAPIEQQAVGQQYQAPAAQRYQTQQQQPQQQQQQQQQQQHIPQKEQPLLLQHQQQLHQQQQHQIQQQPQQQQPISVHTPYSNPQNALDTYRQPRHPDKKTVCVYWLKNNCHRGDACGFLHQFDTARMPLCPNFRKFGSCPDADCPFKHSLDDLKECNMYRLGFCVYGPNCRYRHDPLPGPPPPPESVEAARPRHFQRFGHDFDSFGRGRGRFQPYTGPGRGMRPFQVHPPMQNGTQMVSSTPSYGQPIQ